MLCQVDSPETRLRVEENQVNNIQRRRDGKKEGGIKGWRVEGNESKGGSQTWNSEGRRSFEVSVSDSFLPHNINPRLGASLTLSTLVF